MATRPSSAPVQTGSSAPPPRGASLTDQAHAQIRRRIITCDMPPGLEVSEQELADRLGMSKTPVREALARLSLEGFVEAFPRRGYRVIPVTIQSVNDLFVVRGALEGKAAELAADHMADAEIEALAALTEVSYTPGEGPSVEAFIEANFAFHAAIAGGAGVPRLTNLIVAHLEEATRLFYMGANIRDVNTETNLDHRRIVDVLRRRSGPEAREALIEHNENTRRGLLASLIENRRSELSL